MPILVPRSVKKTGRQGGQAELSAAGAAGASHEAGKEEGHPAPGSCRHPQPGKGQLRQERRKEPHQRQRQRQPAGTQPHDGPPQNKGVEGQGDPPEPAERQLRLRRGERNRQLEETGESHRLGELFRRRLILEQRAEGEQLPSLVECRCQQQRQRPQQECDGFWPAEKGPQDKRADPAGRAEDPQDRRFSVQAIGLDAESRDAHQEKEEEQAVSQKGSW